MASNGDFFGCMGGWIRVLAAVSVLCCVVALPAPGAAAQGTWPVAALQSPITAEPLAQALDAFIAQTGIQFAYPSTLTQGLRSQFVPAGLTPAAALAKMLDGTGLEAHFLNDHTVSLARPPEAHPPSLRASEVSAAPFPDVIVTATKREEYLRDIPVSAVVLTDVDMAEDGIAGISDIAQKVPGVEYDFNAQWAGGVLTNTAIRGIDSKVGTATTGIYLDDAPIQARNGNFGNPNPFTYDLDRIEVLRGPQSTLFGPGAEGGAIRYISKDPSTTELTESLRAEIAIPQFGGLSDEVGLALGGPIVVDELGARLALWHRDDGGYIDRIDPFSGALVQANSNAARTDAVRLAFAVTPSYALRTTLQFQYQNSRVDDSSSFYQMLSSPDAGILRNGKLLQQPSNDRSTHVGLNVDYSTTFLHLTAESSYFDRLASATIDTTNEAGAAYFGGYGNPLGPAYPVSYADAVPTLTMLRQIVLSQELRVASVDPAASIHWTAGLFYSRSRQEEVQDTYGIADPLVPGIYSNEDNSDTVASAFGELDWAINSRWTSRIGMRVDSARSDYQSFTGGFALVGTPPYQRGAQRETPLTPQVTLEYLQAPDALLYASISKGYRIGGINSALPSQCNTDNVPTGYSSDSLWSYELGTKRPVFPEFLQITASAFYLRWNDIQQHEVPACQFGFIANAGGAVGRGIDFSADVSLQDHVMGGLSFEDVDIRYDRTVTIDNQIIVERGAIVGGVPHVPPPWSASAYVKYQWTPLSGCEAYAKAEETIHSHNPGPFSELNPRSISYSPLYTADPATYLLNLRLGLKGSHWDAQWSITNALNSLPVLQRNADTGASSLFYAYTFRPRTFGLTGTWHF